MCSLAAAQPGTLLALRQLTSIPTRSSHSRLPHRSADHISQTKRWCDNRTGCLELRFPKESETKWPHSTTAQVWPEFEDL